MSIKVQRKHINCHFNSDFYPKLNPDMLVTNYGLADNGHINCIIYIHYNSRRGAYKYVKGMTSIDCSVNQVCGD